MIHQIMLVALGGALGASLRFLSYALIIRVAHGINPLFATLAVNGLGSLLIGCLFVLIPAWTRGDSEYYKLFFMLGVLGSYTTVSTFSLETVNLILNQDYIKAAAYIIATVFFALCACGVGIILAKRLLG